MARTFAVAHMPQHREAAGDCHPSPGAATHRLGLGAVLDRSMMGTSLMPSSSLMLSPPRTSTEALWRARCRSAAGSDRPGQLALLRWPNPVSTPAAQRPAVHALTTAWHLSPIRALQHAAEDGAEAHRALIEGARHLSAAAGGCDNSGSVASPSSEARGLQHFKPPRPCRTSLSCPSSVQGRSGPHRLKLEQAPPGQVP